MSGGNPAATVTERRGRRGRRHRARREDEAHTRPRRVLLTGAASGIGAAAARALRARGAHVMGLDLRAGDGIVQCDLRYQPSVEQAVAAAIERLGGLDVLINNAAICQPQSAGMPPDAGALAVLDVNLLGPWRATAAALPALLAGHGRGRVVNVASGLSYVALPWAPATSISKRGVVAYSDALRLEHGDEITVTTVYPGWVQDGPRRRDDRDGSLEGLVPPERIEHAARAIVRAALGRPVRDLATTRRGALRNAALRHLPPRLVDRAVSARVERATADGCFRPPESALRRATR